MQFDPLGYLNHVSSHKHTRCVYVFVFTHTGILTHAILCDSHKNIYGVFIIAHATLSNMFLTRKNFHFNQTLMGTKSFAYYL